MSILVVIILDFFLSYFFFDVLYTFSSR